MKEICLLIVLLIGTVHCIMMRKSCPKDELHKSCSFFDEYPCWITSEMLDRVTVWKKKLTHCRSGCYCKPMYVRAYPKGPCIKSIYCRDRRLQDEMEKMPHELALFYVRR